MIGFALPVHPKRLLIGDPITADQQQHQGIVQRTHRYSLLRDCTSAYGSPNAASL